jgi:hypothetical protein
MADLRDFAQQLDDEAQLYLDDNNNSRPRAFAHSLTERLKDTLSIENYTMGYKVQKSQDGRYLGEIFGYALSMNGEVLTLIYSLYNDNIKDGIVTLHDADYQLAINRLQGFYLQCYKGNVAQEIEQDDPLYELSELLRDKPKEVRIGRPPKDEGPQIITVRLLIFSNSFINNNNIKKHRIDGRNVVAEVYDISRLYHLFGSDSDHRIINVDFQEGFKYRIPFIEMEAQAVGYKCFMTMFPGKLLYRLYEDYNTDLLLNNVRFYLGLKGKQENNANVGIQETLRNEKHMFLAYNNGIVALANNVITEDNSDSVNVEEESERADYVKSGIIKSIEDFQIVNGGQTTATLFYSKNQNSKEPISMIGVYIPVKIIVIDGDDNDKKRIATNVTKFSNSQSKVKPGDFSSSNEFNTTMEELSRSITTDEGKKWYYERLRGQYDQEYNRKIQAGHGNQGIRGTYERFRFRSRDLHCIGVWPQDRRCGGRSIPHRRRQQEAGRHLHQGSSYQGRDHRDYR